MIGIYRYRSAIIFPIGMTFDTGRSVMKNHEIKNQYCLLFLHRRIVMMVTVVTKSTEIIKEMMPVVIGGIT